MRFQKMRRFLNAASFTSGTVTRNENTSDDYYTPVISFTNTEGRHIEFSPNITTDPPFYKPGQKVQVAYTASHNKILDYWFMMLVTIIIACAGLIFLIIGTGYFITMNNLSTWAGR